MTTFELLKLLSSESKSKIIIHFINCKCQSVNVTNICGLADLKQANVSKHIMELKRKGVLVGKKNGREVIYSINKDFHTEHANFINTLVEAAPELKKLKCSHSND